MSGAPPPVRLYTPQIQVPDAQSPYVGRDELTPQIAAAADRITGALDQKMKQDANTYASLQLADLRDRYTTRITQARANGEADSGFTPQVNADYAKDLEEIVAGAPNHLAAEAVTVGGASLHGEVHHWALSAETDGIVAGRIVDQASATDKAANTLFTDPSQFHQVMSERLTQLGIASLPGDKKPVMIRQAQTQLTQSYLYGFAAKPGGADIALTEIKGGKLNQFLDPDNRNAIISKIESDQREAQLTAAMKASVAINQYHNGQTNVVPTIPDRNTIGDNHVASLQIQLDDAQHARDAAGRSAMEKTAAAAAAFNSGRTLDANDPQEKAGGNLFYEDKAPSPVPGLPTMSSINNAVQSIEANMKALHPDQPLDETETASVHGARTMLMLQAVKAYGLVPDAMKSDVNVALRNGTPDQMVQAAGFYKQLVDQNHQMGTEFPKETQDAAWGILTRMSRGMQPGAAVADYKEQTAKLAAMTETERSGLDQRFANDIKPSSKGSPNATDTFLAGAYGSSWWNVFGSANVSTSTAIKNEYQQLVRDAYVGNGGDLATAQVSAFDRLSRTWGISYVNGKPEILRDAPETFYGIPGYSPEDNAKWIIKQAEDDFQHHNSMIPLDLVRGHIKLVPMADTGRNYSTDGRPSYQVIWNNDPSNKGREVTWARSDSVPVAWAPDDKKENTRSRKTKTDEFTARLKTILDERKRKQEGLPVGTQQPSGIIMPAAGGFN